MKGPLCLVVAIFVVCLIPLGTLLWITVPGRYSQTVETFYRATVRIRVPGGYGTGTEGRYKGRKIFLTAAHVVSHGVLDASDELEGCSIVRPLRILWVSHEDDLAALESDVESPDGKVLPDLEPVDSVVLGQAVFYCGYGVNTRNWLEWSHVARPRWVEGGYDGFITTGKGWYGSSGSAVCVVVGGQARLAGVLCTSASCTVGNSQHHAFAPVGCQGPSKVRRFLDMAVR